MRIVDLGQRVGRELDVDDRAGDRDDAPVLELGPGARSAVMVIGSTPVLSRLTRRARRVGSRRTAPRAAGRRGARASAPPTISMISVVMASWRARFITRLRLVMSSSALSVAAFIARWRAACSDAAAFEQRGVDARLGVARQQPFEDLVRAGLELVGGAACSSASSRGDGRRRRVERPRASSGISGRRDDLLAAGADEARVDELDHVDSPVEERLAYGRGDRPGILVGRAVARSP